MGHDVAATRAHDRQSEPETLPEAQVHEWRREQLGRLGVPSHLADVYAGAVDWHELELLIARGCDPIVALDILR